ncbi:MAG: leucyl aminopeptidase [Acidobacteriota bacterium]|jgi:leucyl aminopeptidase|nr:leucyl aminopeptidase [Acidobacteriota bacterium]
MQFAYSPESHPSIACDLLAYPVFDDDVSKPSPADPATPSSAPLKALDAATGHAVSALLASTEFKPELHRCCKLHRPAQLQAERLLLVGAGKRSEFTPARLREVAGVAVRAARASHCKKIALVCRDAFPARLAAQMAVEGSLYANYDADLYKTKDREGGDVTDCQLLFEGEASGKADGGEVAEGVRRGVAVGEATNFARTLVNEPANVLTPAQFVQRALDECAKAGLEAQVMEREGMEALGMNALLAVSRGSDQPPKLLLLRTPGAVGENAGVPLTALVGKGVTFDSGGISLKPSDKMEEMKGDMAGGAAVLGAMLALGRLCPQKPLLGLVPLTENLPGGKATKPGDVVKSLSGKTIEIINTDAEGRLILADALAYARTLGATRILDAATLTGACVVALGTVNAGMLGTDQATIDRLRANCAATGEKFWQLPIDDEYKKAIRSEIADMKNVGGRAGGTITAAKFLQEFVEDTPWVHLDIAGMDIDTEGRPFACKGATGFGVRTFVQLLEG